MKVTSIIVWAIIIRHDSKLIAFSNVSIHITWTSYNLMITFLDVESWQTNQLNMKASYQFLEKWYKLSFSLYYLKKKCFIILCSSPLNLKTKIIFQIQKRYCIMVCTSLNKGAWSNIHYLAFYYIFIFAMSRQILTIYIMPRYIRDNARR